MKPVPPVRRDLPVSPVPLVLRGLWVLPGLLGRKDLLVKPVPLVRRDLPVLPGLPVLRGLSANRARWSSRTYR